MNQKESNKPIKYTVLADEVINLFISEVEKEFGFKCCSDGGSMPYDVESLSVGFIAYRKATIEEARELEVILTEKFLTIINANDKIRPYLRIHPYTLDRTNISISFYNKKSGPEHKKSIYHIFQARNQIFYDVYDPVKESLERIFEEPYEEAYKIVKAKT